MTLEEKVKEIIAEQLSIEVSQIKAESSFIEDLGADSLATVELILALEDAFDIEVSEEEAEKMLSVQNAIDYIKKTVDWEG